MVQAIEHTSITEGQEFRLFLAHIDKIMKLGFLELQGFVSQAFTDMDVLDLSDTETLKQKMNLFQKLQVEFSVLQVKYNRIPKPLHIDRLRQDESLKSDIERYDELRDLYSSFLHDLDNFTATMGRTAGGTLLAMKKREKLDQESDAYQEITDRIVRNCNDLQADLADFVDMFTSYNLEENKINNIPVKLSLLLRKIRSKGAINGELATANALENQHDFVRKLNISIDFRDGEEVLNPLDESKLNKLGAVKIPFNVPAFLRTLTNVNQNTLKAYWYQAEQNPEVVALTNQIESLKRDQTQIKSEDDWRAAEVNIQQIVAQKAVLTEQIFESMVKPLHITVHVREDRLWLVFEDQGPGFLEKQTNKGKKVVNVSVSNFDGADCIPYTPEKGKTYWAGADVEGNGIGLEARMRAIRELGCTFETLTVLDEAGKPAGARVEISVPFESN